LRDRIELADAVVALGVLEADSYAALAVAAGTDLIVLESVTPSELAVQLVPERLARRHGVVPLEVDNRLLTYATCRPFNPEAESDLGFATGLRTAIKVATRSAVAAALERCYPRPTGGPAGRAGRASSPAVSGVEARPSRGTPASAEIELCHQIIVSALDAGSSDVHIECDTAGVSIRYRVGETFQPMPSVPLDALRQISERFKIMARVGTAVRNRAQNGAFQVTVNQRLVDVRLSTRPTASGEAIVLRIFDPAAAGATAIVSVPRQKGGRLRILVADDEPITRMLVKVLLERDRYDVLEAINGQQAVEIAQRERPSLVLIDLNMPVMDGYEAIASLRHEFPMSDLPIIVLTASEGDSVERRVLELGADDFLIKPFEPAVLMARVNAVFGRLHLVTSS
jgi:CheY-like chemotaxis protein